MPPESGTEAPSIAEVDNSLLGSLNAYTDAVQGGGREEIPAETATPAPSRDTSDSRQAPPTPTRETEAAAPPEKPTREQPPGTEVEGEEGEPPADDAEAELITEPFSYRADGKDSTFDGIHVVKDAAGEIVGATIDREQLDNLRLRLGRHDHLVTENNRVSSRLQEYDRFQHNGLDRQQYTGINAVRQLWIENAQLAATVATLAKAFDNPDTLAAIVWEAQNGQQAREWQMVQRELATAAREAVTRANSGWTMRQEQTRSAAEMAPDALAGMLSNHLDSLRAQVPELKNLTDADLNEAKRAFGPFAPQIIRRVSAEDVRNQPELSLGQLVVDQSKLQPWLAARAEQRAREASTAVTTSAAARENAARTRAANAGRPAAGAARRPAAATSPTKPPEEGPSWNEIRNEWMQGRYISDRVTAGE